MMLKTLKEITPEILNKTKTIDIIYLKSEFESPMPDAVWFHRGEDEDYNRWYQRDYGDESVKKLISQSEMMKILKEKYNYYNKIHKYFVINFKCDFNTVCITPKPHVELCDEYLRKTMELDNILNGCKTSTPSRRAAPKKRTPAVRVDVRKMF